MNAKQRRFVAEYLTDHNATQAAIRAGYSERSAGQDAHRMLKNAEIAEAVERAEDERLAALGVTRYRVLERIAAHAFTDVRDIAPWDDDGVHPRPSAELTPAQSAAVKSVKHKRRRVIEASEDGTPIPWEIEEVVIEMYPAPAALESLKRALRVDPPERKEITGKDGGPIEGKLALAVMDEIIAELDEAQAAN